MKTVKINTRKMGHDELQSYLKAKRMGNGGHKSKKDYTRKGVKSW